MQLKARLFDYFPPEPPQMPLTSFKTLYPNFCIPREKVVEVEDEEEERIDKRTSDKQKKRDKGKEKIDDGAETKQSKPKKTK
jgi:hypothetical protein